MTPPEDHPPQVIPNGDGTGTDLAIIGGGPVGLFATFYAGMRQMSVTLIDSLPQLGGQLATLYPEKFIYDVGGFPKVRAKDLASSLIEQAMHAQPRLALNQEVRELVEDIAGTNRFTVVTDKGRHPAKTVIVAAGVGAFVPKRLPLPNADHWLARGLHYFVTDIESFRSQRVLIVGGGDSAVDWANALSVIAAGTVLIHRRDVFRAHEASVPQMLASATDVHVFHELRELAGDGRIQRAIIENTRTAERRTIEVDAVLVNIGFDSSLGPIKHWGLTLEGSGIRVDARMQTSRPGIFAVGDVCAYPEKLKLIATGFGEAATAVNFAKKFIDPAANLFPGHSTTVAEQRLPGLAKRPME